MCILGNQTIGTYANGVEIGTGCRRGQRGALQPSISSRGPIPTVSCAGSPGPPPGSRCCSPEKQSPGKHERESLGRS